MGHFFHPVWRKVAISVLFFFGLYTAGSVGFASAIVTTVSNPEEDFSLPASVETIILFVPGSDKGKSLSAMELVSRIHALCNNGKNGRFSFCVYSMKKEVHTSSVESSAANLKLFLMRTRARYNDKRIVLIGHSEGALICCETVALKAPVDTLVLLSCPVEKGIDWMTEQFKSKSAHLFQEKDEQEAWNSFYRHTIDYLIDADGKSPSEDKITNIFNQELVKYTERYDPIFARVMFAEFCLPRFRSLLLYCAGDKLVDIDVPFLLIYGARDNVICVSDQIAFLNKELKRHLIVYTDADHFLMCTDPDEIKSFNGYLKNAFVDDL